MALHHIMPDLLCFGFGLHLSCVLYDNEKAADLLYKEKKPMDYLVTLSVS